MGVTLSEENTRIIIVIPKTLKKQAQELAKADNRSLSNYVRYLIQKDVNKKKGGKAH